MAAVPLQDGEDGVVHGIEHLPLAAEFHLGLGGVDVYVHLAQLHLHVENAGGELAHHLLVLVGLLQSGHEQAGFYLPPVDKEELPVPAGPAAGGLRDKTGHFDPVAAALHLPETQGQLPAQHGVYRALEGTVSGGEQLLLAVPDELDAHLRMGQGHPLDHCKDGGSLGGVLLHELEPGGGVIKQVSHHHGGAQGTTRLLDFAGHAALQGEGSPQGSIRSAGHHLHP